MDDFSQLSSKVDRIAAALDRLAPLSEPVTIQDGVHAYIWQSSPEMLIPVPNVHYVPSELLKGVDRQKDTLFQNTLQFAKGHPANNALLWGARGTGKSSLVKAVHAEVIQQTGRNLTLIEIQREDIVTMPVLLRHLAKFDRQFLLFCDDLSFENQDESYKSLKSVLDGGVEGRPNSVLLYATSNRRHLMSRQMIENERANSIHRGEAVEEKVSVSDRFGLWIGFHNMDQNTYFNIVYSYVDRVKLNISRDELRAKALEWSMTRGARNGRVAWQFFNDLCGRYGVKIDFNSES